MKTTENLHSLELKRAIKQRDEFLKEHPEQQKFQDEMEAQYKIHDNDPFVNIQIIRHHLHWNLKVLGEIKEQLEE